LKITASRSGSANGGIGRDAQGQRGDSRQGESAVLDQQSDSESQILY
jgi:hypothetical protein